MSNVGPLVSDQDPVIRSAGPSDLLQILDMDERARQLVADQRGGAAWLTEHPALSDWPPDRVVGCSLVAEYAGAVVGFLVLVASDRPGRGSIAVVDRVFVEEEAREHGCGDGLLALATDLARERGCRAIEGNALPGDRDTKNLYERAGMKARSIITSIDL